MKQLLPKTGRIVRNLASIAGVLTMAFVAIPPAAHAGEFRAPHEILFDIHKHVRNHILRVVDHAVGSHDGYRHDDGRRYPGPVYVPRYERPSYRYRMYRPYGGYIAAPQVGIGYYVRSGGPVDHDGCGRRDRYDRDRYRDDDRRRRDDRDDEDHD